MTRVAILSRQVTAYHHARFDACVDRFAKVDVLSLANEGKFAQILARVDSTRYGLHRVFPDLATYRQAAAQGNVSTEVTRRLDALDPDAVAIPGWASPESYAALTWARANRRGIVLMSDSQALDARRNPLRDWIKSRIVRSCDAGLTAGRRHRDYLAQLGMPADKVRLGYDAVDNDHFRRGADAARADDAATRQRLGLPARYVLASARFIAKKNLLAVIEAYAQAGRSRPDDALPDLLVAGDGEDRPALESAIARLGLVDRIHLPGFFDYDSMPALYGLAHGFVHVPLTEQWGLVVNEAAAAGLPMVLSETCGAATELLEPGRNGWICAAEDGAALASALGAMISLSTEEAARMGDESRAIVADWGPDRFADELAAAVRVAQTGQGGPLSLLDRQIVRYMSRKVIETVA